MTQLDAHGRLEPPFAADETATLLGFLDYQRATFAWKCSGLDGAGLRATVGVSTMTLGGLLKHLAYVEDDWFWRWLNGRDHGAPWDTVDWKADPDWESHSAADDSPEYLLALWQGAVDRSRAQGRNPTQTDTDLYPFEWDLRGSGAQDGRISAFRSAVQAARA